LEVPSGAIYNDFDLGLLELMNQYGLVRYDSKGFIFRSGIRSNVYVSGRNDVTDNPDLGWFIGRKIAKTVRENFQKGDKQPCLIFIPTAGTGLAAAASLVSFWEGIEDPENRCLTYRIMRESVKSHGAGATAWVNGDYDDNHTFWGGDNVITDAGSKILAAERLVKSGYPAYDMPWLIFVDRHQGGIRKMQEHGFKRIIVCYRLLDITFAMGELGLWPKSVIRSVEEEIKAHQV
jgi:orotate phosphoribosyltransferase